jgi:molybdate transport system permease protein
VTNLFAAPPRSALPVSSLESRWFAAAMLAFVALFVGALLALFAANVGYVDAKSFAEVLRSPDIRAALWLSLWTSGWTVVLGMIFAIPMGYALSRYRFPGHALVDSIVDLPILLPPLIVGLSLLVFFQTASGRWVEGHIARFVLERKGIVLCQLLVSASFGIRAVKLTFDGIDPRLEHVAMTLGSTRAGAFFRVALPMANRGIVVGAILVWTRAFGLYGPVAVVVGTARGRTEVLPSTIYLEQSVGHIEVALALAILMLVLATAALVVVRTVGLGPERQ